MIGILIQGVFLCAGAAICLGIVMVSSGICDLFGAFCTDVNQNLSELDDTITKSGQKYTALDRIKISTKFFEILDFHSTAVE